MGKDSTVDSSEISYAKFENLDYQDIFDYMLSYERGESYQNLPEIVKQKIYDDFLRDDSITSIIDKKILNHFDKEFTRYYQNKKSKNLFIDMDGTLCDFIPCSDVDILYEEGYFFNLNPRVEFIKAIKGYIKENNPDNVYILSNYLSDSEFAYDEKNRWLDKYIPEVKNSNRIFVPCGEDKSDYIERPLSKSDILFDDYTQNLINWEKNGGKGVKVVNNINNKKGVWKGEKLEQKVSKESLEKVLASASHDRKNVYKI